MKIPKFAPLIAACMATLAACSSAPELPGVDDSTKRPANVAQAIDMQRCRGELSASKVLLTEALNGDAIRAAAQRRNQVGADSRVVVVTFKPGSTQFEIPPEHQARFNEQARQAGFIEIRGRTEALWESVAQTRVAQRRAQSAAAYLQRFANVNVANIRVTWQGVGDRLVEGSSADARNANRRVEIQFYPAKPRPPEVLPAS